MQSGFRPESVRFGVGANSHCYGVNMSSDNIWHSVNDPQTEASVLESLVGEAEKHLPLLRRLAEHPRLPAAALQALSEHDDCEVRAAVAAKESASLELLSKLIRDSSADVRYCLAESYTLPTNLLAILLEDENPYVSHRARTTLRRQEVHVVATIPVNRNDSGIDSACGSA